MKFVYLETIDPSDYYYRHRDQLLGKIFPVDDDWQHRADSYGDCVYIQNVYISGEASRIGLLEPRRGNVYHELPMILHEGRTFLQIGISQFGPRCGYRSLSTTFPLTSPYYIRYESFTDIDKVNNRECTYFYKEETWGGYNSMFVLEEYIVHPFQSNYSNPAYPNLPIINRLITVDMPGSMQTDLAKGIFLVERHYPPYSVLGRLVGTVRGKSSGLSNLSMYNTFTLTNFTFKYLDENTVRPGRQIVITSNPHNDNNLNGLVGMKVHPKINIQRARNNYNRCWVELTDEKFGDTRFTSKKIDLSALQFRYVRRSELTPESMSPMS